MEHNLSADLTDSICTLLGHPKQCPHGNPIPEGNCCKKAAETLEAIVVPISKIDVGEEVKLSYMVIKDIEFMNKLISLGLIPGATLSLNKKSPTFVIKINDTQVAISKEIAEFISKYFSKGSRIAVTGSIQTRNWDDTEGKRHYVTEVVVEDAEFVDTKKSQDSGYSSAPVPEEPRAPRSAAPKADGQAQAQKENAGTNSSESSTYFALDDEDGFPF